jgi:hypothetical protein
MGDLGLSLAILRRLGQDRREPTGFLAWADGSGGAWHQDHGIWIRVRCGYPDQGVVHVSSPQDGYDDSSWNGQPEARAATPAERATFLRPLPAWNGVVVGQTASGLAVALEDKSDTALTRTIHGSNHACLFDRVRARPVGSAIVAERLIGSCLSAELRTTLQKGLPWPERLPGATIIFRRAYECARDIATVGARQDLTGRIDTALAHGCARLLDWRSLPGNEVSILWASLKGPLRGESIETRACADTFAVRSAGICVSGSDRAFDVASLASAVANRTMGNLRVDRWS